MRFIEKINFVPVKCVLFGVTCYDQPVLIVLVGNSDPYYFTNLPTSVGQGVDHELDVPVLVLLLLEHLDVKVRNGHGEAVIEPSTS